MLSRQKVDHNFFKELSINIWLLAYLALQIGIESQILMFNLVGSTKHDQSTQWFWKNKPSLASVYFCLLKGQSVSEGYQHGDSCTIALGGVKHSSKSMLWYLHIQHKNKAARRMTEQGEKRRRHRATGRPLMLYWTGVSLPRQPAALNWYLEQQVELLQRIWCSVHIWCQLRWCYTLLLFWHRRRQLSHWC